MSQESPYEYTIYDKYDDISSNIIHSLKIIKNQQDYDKIVEKWKNSKILEGNENLKKLNLEKLEAKLLSVFEKNNETRDLEELEKDLSEIVPPYSVAFGKKSKKSKSKKSKKSKSKKSKKSKSKKSKKGGRRMRNRNRK